jgi:amino acid transporter
MINRRGWVRTGTDFAVLSQTLDRLKWYKPDEVSPREEMVEATRVLSPPLAGSEMGLGGSTVVGEGTPPKFVHVTHV